MTAPLEGVRVLELARILAGPWAGQTLADLGAEVIKVESPAGDDTRGWGPPFIESDGDKSAAYFHGCNRGKSSVVADLNDPKDLKRVLSLAEDADVIIENFKQGGLVRFGLDYAALFERNPGVVYCSITGFGQTGPRGKEPGYDLLIQAMSGVMDITGAADGPPTKMGVAFADIFSGLYAVIAIQAALAERARSGQGQQIDISLFDCMLAVLANQAQNYFATGISPKRRGNAHPNLTPYEVFETRTGHVVIAVGNDRQFQRLCNSLGAEALGNDPRYLTNADRIQNRETLFAALSEHLAAWDKTELVETLTANGVPAGPINTVEEALGDTQTKARGMVVAPGGNAGLRTPVQFSRSELHFDKGVPSHGETALNEANWRPR